MKLSTKTRYGLRIIVQIAARQNRQRPVLARELSEEQDITPAYVDQILIPLRQSGLVVSYRGRYGGYKLGRPADEITALEVVETLDGDLDLVGCVRHEDHCPRSGSCVAREVWVAVSNAICRTLAQFSETVAESSVACHAG